MDAPPLTPIAPPPARAAARLGIVVIGRNEMPRLRVGLAAVQNAGAPLVYVDSESRDGSPEYAESCGVRTLRLTGPPLTAARGREAGLAALLAQDPDLAYVQFIDGDCELAPDWLAAGLAELTAQPDCAVVFGRVRERYPTASVYNRLCDLEWDRPVGDVDACGGIALWRIAALRAVGGFNPALIAGEEPELCFRVRRAGWRVRRMANEMTLHDADIHRFGQWWRRSVRTGHAYAEAAHLYRTLPEPFGGRETRSALVWGAALPALSLAAALLTHGWGLLLLGGYIYQWRRIYRHQRERGRSPAHGRLAATFELLSKFAQAQGVLKQRFNRLRGRRTPLIEYKQVAAAPPGDTTATQARSHA